MKALHQHDSESDAGATLQQLVTYGYAVEKQWLIATRSAKTVTA
jgi:hypothetical protein